MSGFVPFFVAAVTVLRSAQSDGVALAAVIATATVGLAAPIITGFFVSRSTRRTLDAERARLADTLSAEQNRLRAQLSHERSMSDLAELRAVLDDGAGAIRRAMWATHAIVDFIRRQPRYATTPRRRTYARREMRFRATTYLTRTPPPADTDA